MNGSDMIEDVYELDRFEYILNEAERNTATGWEEVMVSNIREAYQRLGKRMFIPTLTREHLERIARNEN